MYLISKYGVLVDSNLLERRTIFAMINYMQINFCPCLCKKNAVPYVTANKKMTSRHVYDTSKIQPHLIQLEF